MKLYTSIKKLKNHSACYNPGKWGVFMRNMNLKSENEPFSISDGLEFADIKDCVWALRTQNYKDICRFSADVVRLVEPIYSKQHTSDRRVQRCISMIYKYSDSVGLCSENKLRSAAHAAAHAAADAADAAAAAAAAAHADTDAADAAYTAAYTAADAAYAAAYAATAATYTATYAAADAATYAATYAERSTAKKVFWAKIEKLFIQHFND